MMWGDDNRSHTKLYGQIIRGNIYHTLFEYNGEDCHIYHQIVMRLVIKEIVKTIGDNKFKDYEVLKELNYATVSGRLVIIHLKDASP